MDSDNELTFEQQQEIDRLSKLANTSSSNSNKYRHQLYAYINSLIAIRTKYISRDETTGKLVELSRRPPKYVRMDSECLKGYEMAIDDVRREPGLGGDRP